MIYTTTYKIMKQAANNTTCSLSKSAIDASDVTPETKGSNMLDFTNSNFAMDSTGVEAELKNSLKSHYAKLLAAAFKKSTGTELKDPEKHIDPRYGYVIGRAANIDPEILAKLSTYYRDRLSGFTVSGKNLDPRIAMDAVRMSNFYGSSNPLNYRELGLERNKAYPHNVKIQANYVDK